MIPNMLNKKEILIDYLLTYQMVFKKKEIYKELVAYLDNALKSVVLKYKK
jgi:hypothetical protein